MQRAGTNHQIFRTRFPYYYYITKTKYTVVTEALT